VLLLQAPRIIKERVEIRNSLFAEIIIRGLCVNQQLQLQSCQDEEHRKK